MPAVHGAPFTFANTGSLATARQSHTATLLPSGKVLIAGGFNASPLASAELYDPGSGSWTATGNLGVARRQHTATVLPNGKVLVAGGRDASGALMSAELYDPATGMWSPTNGLSAARRSHTATLLRNGKVLVAGGFSTSGTSLGSAELYDPASGTWTTTGSLGGRGLHTATLLANDKVLVAGGLGTSGNALATAELYDPATGNWTITGSLIGPRYLHTATLLPNGKVLVAGGNNTTAALGTAVVYDPASGNWATTGGLTGVRDSHTATLLPNGKVLVAGGLGSINNVATAELYDSATGTWAPTGGMSGARQLHTATVLPSGQVLVAAGSNLASAELFDPASGNWTATGNLGVARYLHTATLLPNGKVLVVGGGITNGILVTTYFASAELYDPANGTWSITASLNAARGSHTATLLPNGKVLVAGGSNASGSLASAELYDPVTGTWTGASSLGTARVGHTATLLSSGKVLAAGGTGPSGALASAELYDPATGNWTFVGNLGTARHRHTATLLPNGKVLVAGGINLSGNTFPNAELYDPATGNWTGTGPLGASRHSHTAILLASGKVLVAAGGNNAASRGTSELYDPASGTWSATGNLITARSFHGAALLPNGKPCVVGGITNVSLASAEVYDPATGLWTATGSLNAARHQQTVTLLATGKVLVAGGSSDSGYLMSAELYTVGLGFLSPDWQPQIVTAPLKLKPAESLTLTGSRFQGISQASGGSTQDSSSNYPIVQLLSLDSGQVAFLPVNPTTGWSDTTFTSTPVSGFPFGPALLTVFTNGIPSTSKYLFVAPPNSAPVANAQSVATEEDTAVPVTLAGSDVDGDALSFAIVTNPANGTLTGTGANRIYTPAGNYNGPDSFTFQVNDGEANSSAATVSIGITAVNDPPSFTKGPNQTTAGTSPKTVSNWATNITAGAPNESGQALTFLLSNNGNALFSEQPAVSSTGTLTYTPIANGSGTVTVSVTLKDNGGTTNGGQDTAAVQTFTITINATTPGTVTTLANISTRLRVETGDNILIGGFIITGTQPKKVIVRGIGTSLPLADKLTNPTLELHGPNGLIEANDNWVDSPNKQAIMDSGIPPSNDLESAIVQTLPANNAGYTAIVRGVNDGTGIGVVEAYDLDTGADSRLANISTRGFVQTGDNVLIAGTIVVGQASQRVIIRAIGPSLPIVGKLENPTLELRDENGGLLEANDNWIDSPNKQAIIDSMVAPSNDAESAIVRTLSPAAYTAVVSGVSDTTGIAVVEVYALQ